MACCPDAIAATIRICRPRFSRSCGPDTRNMWTSAGSPFSEHFKNIFVLLLFFNGLCILPNENKTDTNIFKGRSIRASWIAQGWCNMAQNSLRLVEGNSVDKTKALDAALSQIERAFGKGSIMRLGRNEQVVEIETVSTGSLTGRYSRSRRAAAASKSPSTRATPPPSCSHRPVTHWWPSNR